MKKSIFTGLLLAMTLPSWLSCDKDLLNNDQSDSNVKVVWESELALPINPALGKNYMPAVDENGNTYVMMRDWADDDGGYVLQAFDMNGEVKWTKTEPDDNVHNQMVMYANGMLYYPTKRKIVCVNTSDGSEEWSYVCPDSLWTSGNMVMSNQQLITSFTGFTADHSYIFAFDPYSGDIDAYTAAGGRNENYTLAAVGSYLYLTFNKLNKYQVNTGTIDLIWSVLLPGNQSEADDTYTNMTNDIVVDPDNDNIYFTYENFRQYNEEWLVAYNKDGDLLWSSEVYASTHLTVDFDNHLYVSNGSLHKLDGNTGRLIWSAEPPSETMGLGNSIDAVVQGNDEVLYAGDYFGVYGISTKGEVKFTAFPSSITGDETPLTFVNLLGNGNIVVLAMATDEGSAKLYCLACSSDGVKDNIWAKIGATASNSFNLTE